MHTFSGSIVYTYLLFHMLVIQLLCCGCVNQVIGVVNITTLSNRQYCVVLDPVDAKGNPQFGRKKLMKGEKTFFLMPGERLEKGIQNIYVLGEDEGVILKAVEGFIDSVKVPSLYCQMYLNFALFGFYGCRLTAVNVTVYNSVIMIQFF